MTECPRCGREYSTPPWRDPGHIGIETDGGRDLAADEGMLCHGCGREHSDWTKTGEGSVDDGHSSGKITAWECDHCGSVEEVPSR